MRSECYLLYLRIATFGVLISSGVSHASTNIGDDFPPRTRHVHIALRRTAPEYRPQGLSKRSLLESTLQKSSYRGNNSSPDSAHVKHEHGLSEQMLKATSNQDKEDSENRGLKSYSVLFRALLRRLEYLMDQFDILDDTGEQNAQQDRRWLELIAKVNRKLENELLKKAKSLTVTTNESSEVTPQHRIGDFGGRKIGTALWNQPFHPDQGQSPPLRGRGPPSRRMYVHADRDTESDSRSHPSVATKTRKTNTKTIPTTLKRNPNTFDSSMIANDPTSSRRILSNWHRDSQDTITPNENQTPKDQFHFQVFNYNHEPRLTEVANDEIEK